MVNSGVATRLRTRSEDPSSDFDPNLTQRSARLGWRTPTHLPPAGRALLGGLLVAAAAVGLFASAIRAGAPQRSYAVAARTLAAGTDLAVTDLELEPLALPNQLRKRSFDTTSKLIGTKLVTPLAEGELVQASAVVAAGSAPDRRELSFSVDAGALSGTLLPGQRIDVIATYGTSAEAVTAVAVHAAQVMTLSHSSSVVSGGDVMVTVGLDTDNDALALAHAIALGRITVVRTAAAPQPITFPSAFRTPGADNSVGGSSSGGSR